MRTTLIWGANTGVGKTLVSAGLMRAAAARAHALYLKPVQTGCPEDSDGRHVAQLAGGLPHMVGPHAAATDLQGSEAVSSSSSHARTLFAWRQPVSPDLAALREGRPVDDVELLASTRAAVAAFCTDSHVDTAIGLIETAGGVASPAPSGSLQCDALRPLAASSPSLLVGDGKLGGISQTICAFESLASRGFEVGPLVLLSGSGRTADRDGSNAGHLRNADALRAHFGNLPVFELPLPPAREEPTSADASAGHDLAEWMEETSDAFNTILDAIQTVHELRESTGAAPEMLAMPRNQIGAAACPYAGEKVRPNRTESERDDDGSTTSRMLAADMRLLWHPYTSTTKPTPCLPVTSASGVRLKLADGRELIDGMSSWWCTIHGCKCHDGASATRGRTTMAFLPPNLPAHASTVPALISA